MADPRYSIDALAPEGAPTLDRKYGIDALTGPPPTPAPAAPTEQPYSGSILPFSRDAQGSVSFDSNAGIVGAFKRAFTAPGDVLAGKIDPYSEEGASRAREAAGFMSPVSAARRAGEAAIPGITKAAKPAVPTAEALKEASGQGFEQARKTGVEYSAPAVKDMAAKAQQELNDIGLLDIAAPETHQILKRLQNVPNVAEGESVSARIKDLIAARQALQAAAQNFSNPREQRAASAAIEQLDQFLLGGDAPGSLAGAAAPEGAAAVSKILSDARGNYAAGMRSERVTAAGERGELNAATANSGHNVDNAIRQRIKALLLNKKDSAGYSEEELALMEKLARGTLTSNGLRELGNLLGGGGGVGATVLGSIAGAGTATATGSPWGVAAGAIPPLVGYAARRQAGNLTQKQLENIDQTVRMRSPLYERAPLEPTTPGKGAALLRLLLIDRLDHELRASEDR